MPDSPTEFNYPAKFNDIIWYRTNVPCMEACPVRTDSGRYVQLIAENRYEDAFFVARSPNPLTSICGRVCTAPCEDACRRSSIDQAVTIRSLKRFVTDRYGVESSRPDTFMELSKDREDPGCRMQWHLSHLSSRFTKKINKKVAIIGSGPAGLSCAHDLAVMGYNVTVFEALRELGGMMRYGIPEYRLPRGVISREIASLEQFGVEFCTDTPINPQFNFHDLRKKGFDAIFLGIGAMMGRDMNIPGIKLKGVVRAVDYLHDLNRGHHVEIGEKVAVIGGGLVAIDAARTAVRGVEFLAMDSARAVQRLNPENVTIVYRRSAEELLAPFEEIHQAEEEGVQFHFLTSPVEFMGDDEGNVRAVKCQTMKLGEPDDSGRRRPVPVEGSEFEVEADMVIMAIGQQVDHSFLSEKDGVEMTEGGIIKIDPETLATTAPGVYAGGDAAFGPRIAIEAAANGKRAAQSIHEYLGGEPAAPTLAVEISKINTSDFQTFSEYEKWKRSSPSTADVERRTSIVEVEECYTEEEAAIQAQRCLYCHIDTIYDPMKCVLCGRCADICPEKCLVFLPLDHVDMPEEQKISALKHYDYDAEEPLTVLVKDDTACIRCGLCATRCPTDAMTMERFNFVEMET